MTVDRAQEASAAELPTGGRWLRSVVAVVLLLAACGWLNITLNDASGRSTVAASRLLHLDSRLHEEGTLQWRALAPGGPPTRVAADVGRVRAAERELVEELAELMPAAEVVDLQGQIDDYHVALDEELSLLAVGRAEDAVAFEREVTTPGFLALSSWLQDRSDVAAASAARWSRLAHVLLLAMLAAVAAVIGVLVWRADRAHRTSVAIGAQLLESERATVEHLRTTEAAVRHQAEHDPLTGLPNRLQFSRRLATVTAASEIAVLFLDLDGFKAINDELGHAAGDELLIAVGERLRRCARQQDTVARLGGDEFALLLVGADEEIAAGVAARIRQQLRMPVSVGGREVTVGASVGVALGGVGAEPDQLLSEADHRMYQEKRAVHSRASTSPRASASA